MLKLVTITDHDRGWLVGETESVTFEPNVKFKKSFFGSISLVSLSGYEWSMCKNVKSESVKITCTATVPADEQLKGPLVAKGYWADCKDGYVLGPILCDEQGSADSQSFYIYNDSIPVKPTTSSTSTIFTTSVSTTSVTSTTSTTSTSTRIPTASKKTSTPVPSSSSSKTLAILGVIFGVLVFLICLGILGFVLWAKNQDRKEKNLHELLDFDIDPSKNKPIPRTIPKAESPFPDRPVYYHHQMPVMESIESQGYLMVASDGRQKNLMQDMDEIFKKVKKQIAPASTKKDEAPQEMKKELKKRLPNDGFSDSRGNNKRKMTEDGLLIYSAEELNVGKGGDTDDCPFDCWCCF